MADYTVTFRESGIPDTTRNPSPDLWADCPWDDITRGEYTKQGLAFFDDFTNTPLQPTLTTQIGYGQYKAYATSGETIAGVAGSSINSVIVPGGVIALSAGTSGHQASLAQAYSSYLLSGTAGTIGKLWFEARIAVSSVAASHLSTFIGLAEVDAASFTLGASIPWTSATAISNTGSQIGFVLPGATPGAPKFSYADRATGYTDVMTGIKVGGSYSDGVLTAPAAGTAYQWVKLGFKYDASAGKAVNNPTSGSAGSACISIWADNVVQSSYMSLTTLAGTTNLGTNALGLLLAVWAGASASTDAVYMDWWKVAQLF